MLDVQESPVAASLAEALETMAFISALPVDELGEPGEALTLVTVGFTRPNPGRLELLAPRALGRLLAENILGPEDMESFQPSQGDDALGELGNIACGALLRRFSNQSHEPFQMGIPDLAPFTGDWADFCRDSAVLDADGHVLAIRASGVE
jgi:chemotaxis protein CheY-P-specific phosphatase CheC